MFCMGSWWKILAETRIGLRAGPSTDLVSRYLKVTKRGVPMSTRIIE